MEVLLIFGSWDRGIDSRFTNSNSVSRPSQEEITVHMVLCMHKFFTCTVDMQNIYYISGQCYFSMSLENMMYFMMISENLLAF